MTISDIAKMAGVSSAAVSRYFNNGYLSEEKRRAIHDVVEMTGYHPSLQARMLRTKETKTIGVIIPELNSSAMGRMIHGILETLDENGYRMLLADTRNDAGKEMEYLSVFDENQVDGVIISGTVFSDAYRDAIKQMEIPVVVIGQELQGVNSVFHDDYHASYDITSLFLKKGRKKLGYLGVTEEDRAVGELRYNGYCDALRDGGAFECASNYVISDFYIKSGYEKMAELYAAHPDLDGVICATDRIAGGAQQWVREHAPEQLMSIAFGGYGDTELAQVCIPPLSTVHFYYSESGRKAAQLLLELLAEEAAQDAPEERPVQEIRMGYELIDRIPEK